MRTRRGLWLALGLMALTPVAAADPPAPTRYGLGRPASQAEIAAWNIDVRGDGAGLPSGRGSVAEGRTVYGSECAACHGAAGEGGVGDRLVGGVGTLASTKPIRTVGSYWPFAPTVFDYVRRAMPFDAPESLTPSQTYAVVAYVLYLNHIIPAGAVMDAHSLPRVRMPNRNGFISPDPRPDVP